MAKFRKQLRCADFGIGLLQMRGNRVMNKRLDTPCVKKLLQFVTAFALDDKKMIHVAFRHSRCLRAFDLWIRNSMAIAFGNLATAAIPGIQMRKFFLEERSLYFVKAGIHSKITVFVLTSTTVIRQRADHLCKGGVI